jgi:hypothetical protein
VVIQRGATRPLPSTVMTKGPEKAAGHPRGRARGGEPAIRCEKLEPGFARQRELAVQPRRLRFQGSPHFCMYWHHGDAALSKKFSFRRLRDVRSQRDHDWLYPKAAVHRAAARFERFCACRDADAPALMGAAHFELRRALRHGEGCLLQARLRRVLVAAAARKADVRDVNKIAAAV